MIIRANVKTGGGSHEATVETDGRTRSLAVPAKSSGHGSDVNGGELLFLALATCYCNDVYREAAKLDLTIDEVRVAVWGEFGAAGEPAKWIRYQADVSSPEPADKMRDLLVHTDSVAEIHNTLRAGTKVTLQLA